MRTKEDVLRYSEKLERSIVLKCKECGGANPRCECSKKHRFLLSAYEACVPSDFWRIKRSDIDHNEEIFDDVILKYISKLNRALAKGYGLILTGDNGVGKTCFISYILVEAIKRGRTAYYTTLPQLEHDIKLGFERSKDESIQKRIDLFLTSDFLAIDEVAKEKRKKKKKEQSFMDIQIERILKQRYDDGMPVLLAANVDRESLMNSYNSTVNSMFIGKYRIIQMAEGDYREKMAKKMSSDMGY